MPKLTDTFNPESCEELTGYTFRDVIAMYEDYERMAKDLEAIQNIGEYTRGWEQGRNDTIRAHGIKIVPSRFATNRAGTGKNNQLKYNTKEIKTQ